MVDGSVGYAKNGFGQRGGARGGRGGNGGGQRGRGGVQTPRQTYWSRPNPPPPPV